NPCDVITALRQRHKNRMVVLGYPSSACVVGYENNAIRWHSTPFPNLNLRRDFQNAAHQRCDARHLQKPDVQSSGTFIVSVALRFEKAPTGAFARRGGADDCSWTVRWVSCPHAKA